MGKILPLPKTINNLTIVSNGKFRYSSGGNKIWTLNLICFCGKNFTADKGNIMQGHTKSCGCLQPPGFHGLRGTPIYKVWDGMMQRCYNNKLKSYKNYGERGIKVCKSWHTFINFNKWCLENGWEKGLELDRKKNNKGYSPSNCRFVTHSVNNRNKRNNVKYLHNGEMKTISELSELSGINFKSLSYRLTRWSVEEAITRPIKK